jgi:GDPmannose 4,6-dehydratase
MIDWIGDGDDEVGSIRELDEDKFRTVTGLKDIALKVGSTPIHIDASYNRPTEVDLLVGDASKAERELGWKSATDLNELIRIMVEADVERCRLGQEEF